MGLTPLDVENIRFRGALAGYHRIEVEHFMQRVAAALEEKLEEIQRLQLQVSTLTKEVEQNREVENLLKNSVILAQKTCDELITSAHTKADLILQEAQAEGQQIKWRFAELKSDQEQFEYAFHGLLSGFMHRLEQGNPALQKPGVTAALPAQQPGGPDSIPAGGQPASPSEGGPPISEVEVTPEILTPGKPRSAKLAFGQAAKLPKVVLTQAQGLGVDRDEDISGFESAVSDAKAEQLGWETPSSSGETATAYIEPGKEGQESPLDSLDDAGTEPPESPLL